MIQFGIVCVKLDLVVCQKSELNFVTFFICFLFSENFLGVPCSSDGECAYLSTTCNIGAGVCNVKPLAELEVNYVKCYLERISSSIEVCEMKS